MSQIPEGLQDAVEERRRRTTPRTPTPTTTVTPFRPEAGFFDSLFYYAGKPEEWTVKLAGSLLSDDPKYKFGSGTGYTDQVSFITAMRDLGADSIAESLLGGDDPNDLQTFPLASVLLGIGAAIANPLDPINKLKILGLTKKGRVAELIDGGRKGILSGKAGRELIDTAVLESRIAKVTEELKTPGISKQAVKSKKLTLSQLKAAQKNQVEINSILKAAHEQGAKTEDFVLAKSKTEQILQGQRRLIGLSHPFKMDQLSLLGQATGLKFASGNPLTAGLTEGIPLSKLEASIVSSFSGLKNVTKDIALKAINHVNEALGYAKVGAERTREIGRAVEKVANATTLETSASLRAVRAAWIDMADQHKLTKTQLDEVYKAYVDGIEDVTASRASDIDIMGKALEGIPEGSQLDDLLASRYVKRGQADEVIDTVPVSDIDPKTGTLVVTDSGLRQGEAARAVDAFEATSVPKISIGQHRALATNDKFIIKLEHPFQDVDVSRLSQLEGIPRFEKVRRGTTDYLVTRRRPGFNLGSGKDALIDGVHVNNIEVLGAQLAARKFGLVDLRPGDFAIAEHGEILLLNPDKIRQARSIEAARVETSASLYDFVREYEAGTVGLEYTMTHLSSDAAARSANARARKLAKRRSSVVLPKDKETSIANSFHLLDGAVNADIERRYAVGGYVFGEDMATQAARTNLTSEVERSLAVDQIRKAIRAELAGGPPKLNPIEVAALPDGGYEIVRGKAELLAAVLEEIPVVQVKRVNRYAEEVAEEGYYIGKLLKGEDVFSSEPQHIATEALKEADQFRDVLSRRYKLTNRDGSRRVFVGPEIRRSPVFKEFLDGTGNWVGSRAGKTPLNKKESIKQAFVRRGIADEDVMSLALMEAAAGSDSYRTFLNSIRESYGIEVAFTDLRTLDLMERKFSTLVDKANRGLDALAERGIFTDATLASRAHLFDGVVEHLDEIGDLRFTGKEKSLEELAEHAKAALNRSSQEIDVVPYAKIGLQNAEESRTILARDLLDGPRPNVAFKARRPRVFSDEFKRQLEDKKIFGLDNSTSAKLREEGLDSVTGRLIGKAEEGVFVENQRRVFGLFHTVDGQLFVGTKKKYADNIGSMLEEMYGDGIFVPGEFGYVTAGTVVLNGPVHLDLYKTLDNRTITRISSRLRDIAHKLISAGFSKDIKLRLNTPYSGLESWETFLRNKNTLGHVSDPSFRLHVPKDKLNMQLDYVHESPNYRIARERPRFAHQGQQELYNFIQNISDELLREEVLRGIPTRQIENYIPRIKTSWAEKASKALSSQMERMRVTDKKLFKATSPFLKDRAIIDLKTHEVNDVIRALRKEGYDNPEALFLRLFDKTVKEGEKTAVVAMAKALDEIGAPLESGFWHEDALLALGARVIYSASERFALGFVDSLKKSGAALVVPIDDIDVLKTHRADLTSVGKEIAESKLLLDDRTVRLDEALKAPELNSEFIDGLRKEIDELSEKYRGLIEKSSEINHTVNKYGAMAHEIDLSGAKFAYVQRDKAAELLRSGKIRRDDLFGNIEDGLVPIPVESARSVLGGKDELIFFTSDAMPVVERYFGMSRSSGNAGKVLHWLRARQNDWKEIMLFPVPQYHGRNFLSNGLLAWMGGVTDPESYNTSWRVLRAITKPGGFDDIKSTAAALKDHRLVNDLGEETTAYDLWNEFVLHGGVSSGLNFNEVKYAGTSGLNSDPIFTDLKVRQMRAGHLPAREAIGRPVMNNIVMREGRKVAAGIEDRYRFAAFYHHWKRSASFDTAGMQMKAIFYDYRDLSTLERRVLKGVLPFYSWSRHNIPRMIEMAYMEPVKFYRYSKAVDGLRNGTLDGTPYDEKDIPQWLAGHGIFTGKTNAGNYVIRAGDNLTPMGDLFRFLESPAGTILGGATPIGKLPVELLSGTSLYMKPSAFEVGSPLQPTPGALAAGTGARALGMTRGPDQRGPLGLVNSLWNEYILKSTLRPVNEYMRIVENLAESLGKDPSPGDLAPKGLIVTALDAALGHARAVNPTESRVINQRIRTGLLQGLKRGVRYALKKGDTEQAEYQQKMYLRELLDTIEEK